ncbi:EamA family transporter [Affinibrenneria salicis]|uniref:EamA family transporter n=1 Tax=Affinibrenneria salicis TaxID=2590031 RepID=A0A5J5FZH8_9GAMM|nr:EamA family transporter [Affinibrenneria salicis]KAA8999433.1 EamA family transporter [Affinibrenneria salicis]
MAGRHFLLLLLVVSGWAFNVVAMKFGLMELPPLLMMMLRFIIVAAVLVPFTRLQRRQCGLVWLLAFTFGFIHFALLALGMRYTDAGSAALLVQMGTPMAMLLAALWLKEPLSTRQVAGIALAFAGVAVMAGSPTLFSWRGLLFLLTSAAGWACSNILIKRAPPIAPLTLSGWVSLFSIPFVAVSSLLFEHNQISLLLTAGWRGWLGVLYSALGSSLMAYSLWYWLLKKYPVNLIMPYSLLSPALALLMGAAIMGDPLNASKLLGAALILGGIFIAVVSGGGRMTPAGRRR